MFKAEKVDLREDYPRIITADTDGFQGVEKFTEVHKIKIIENNTKDLEFDFIGAFPALANALRRIMISEVPTVCIEKVTIAKNSTVLRDELLAHRLGLIPLRANGKLFQYKVAGDSEGTDRDSLHFKLKVKCSENPNASKSDFRPDNLYSNRLVKSGSIKWVPIGEQSKLYKEAQVGPVYDDIVIVKMKPGHEIDATMVAVKGIGRDHAKFSPVALCSYRLMPVVKLLQEVTGQDAELLKACFSPGVINLVEERGVKKAVVANPRKETCSRNHFYYENIKDKVSVSLDMSHYIFSIESECGESAAEIFKEAVKILKSKAQTALVLLEELGDKKKQKKKKKF